MNSWESLWPDGQIGWPRRADPAAVLLHLTPALLLIALTETIAAYRRTVTDLLEKIGPADPTAPRTAGEHIDPDTADPDPLNSRRSGERPDLGPAASRTPGTTSVGQDRTHMDDSTPDDRPVGPGPRPFGGRATDADVWPRAVALDDAARAATGKPVSVWRLRTDLRIGPRRARQLREQLLARRLDPPPPIG